MNRPSSSAHHPRTPLGVLYTGYLEKSSRSDSYSQHNPKKRFVVLTHVGIHWFKRQEGYDLFGEEKGHILVAEISKVRATQRRSKFDCFFFLFGFLQFIFNKDNLKTHIGLVVWL